MKLKINHVEGSKKGTVDTFDVPVLTVGRDPSNVLAFDAVKDDRVSTKHAAFSEQGGGLVVTDLGSRNGTFVNGQRISGPTPVPSGALVQFGENGPMIMVAYETPAASPAKPAAKKGGGCGALIVVVLLLVLVAAGAAGAFFLLRGKKSGGSAWSRVGVGSSYTTLTETHLEAAGTDTKYETTMTLVSRTEDVAKVKQEMNVPDSKPTENDYPLKPKPDDKPPPKPLEEKNESVTVPAGTFECHYTKTSTEGATSETWMNDDIPVAVKYVVSSAAMKITATLTKIDKK